MLYCDVTLLFEKVTSTKDTVAFRMLAGASATSKPPPPLMLHDQQSTVPTTALPSNTHDDTRTTTLCRVDGVAAPYRVDTDTAPPPIMEPRGPTLSTSTTLDRNCMSASVALFPELVELLHTTDTAPPP